MLSRFAKLMLTATSLAPVLATVGVARWSEGDPWLDLVPWFGAAVGLGLVAWLLALVAARKLPRIEVRFVEIKRSDTEVLTFLLTYLLPLVASPSLGMGSRLPVTLFVFGVIALAVYHADAYTFNPVLGCFGYHFYEVKLSSGATLLLITTRPMRQASGSLLVVELFEPALLAVEV